MLKYSVDLKGSIDTFVSQFSFALQSLFNYVDVIVDSSNQTKLTVVNRTTSEELLYCYVVNTVYNGRSTLLLKTYGLNIYPETIVVEDQKDWGPMVTYTNNSIIYGRAGFITSASQLFIVDTIEYCLDTENEVQYYIGLGCEEYANPMFIISPTNLGNIGVIGVMDIDSLSVDIRTLTYNNNTTVEHNLKILQIPNSSITSMTKFFIPESTDNEYFLFVYLINGLQHDNLNVIKFDNHLYIPCLNNCIALLIF